MCMCETQFEESLPGFHKINVIVNLFLTFALMTFIHSFIPALGKLWRLQGWTKEFLTTGCS